MRVKEFIKNRNIGFWTSAATAVIAIVTAIVYAACYGGTKEFGVGALVCIAVCAAAAIAAAFVPKANEYIPYALVVLSAAALGFYVYSIYYYVSVVLVGIDLDSFSAEFIASTALFVSSAVAAAVNLFFKQGKKQEGAEK